MACTQSFIEQFGNLTFNEHPFCDGDAAAFCEISYMPLSRSVSPSLDDEPVPFSKMADEVFAYCGNRYAKLGLMINADISRIFMQIADTARYGNIKVISVEKKYSFDPALQFCVATYLLPDDTIVICFEGTDDTIAGWKEDLDMLLRKGTPAYKEAVNYVNAVAEKFDGEIILAGHSKGGNEALYVALTCSDEIRNRIKYIYNNDGPGFYTDKFFKTDAYKQLGNRYRHFVPYSSFVGMMMAHDNDYRAVDSTKRLGAFQHDMCTWKIKDGNFECVDDIDFLAKITDLFLSKFVGKINDSLYSDLDKIFVEIIKGAGQETLSQLASNIIPTLKGIGIAWRTIEPEAKEIFMSTFKGSGKLMKECIKTVKNKTKETAEKVAAVVS